MKNFIKNYDDYTRSLRSLGLIKNVDNSTIKKDRLQYNLSVKFLLLLSLVFISIISFVPTISSDVISINSGGSEQWQTKKRFK